MFTMIPGLLLSAALTLTGIQPSSPTPHPTPTATSAEEVKTVNAQYEPVAAPYPPAVQSALSKVRKSGGHTIVRANGKSYVVIGAGQRPTGGYQLVADQVKRTGPHGFTVSVHVKAPAPGSMKIQVISYPTLVIALPDQQAQVTVQMR
ncbi:protease complex subunit PrcB family protein [Brevibacillus nitrificans]|uniref:Protease complex subunit PrcB family protein n=1 Tax=Brevibacillus nitrificans TaxID=651560 RepID=A0A3M8DNM0_9BACL|nr:protease complex subunit PrcB family protein [Brevibacillus nitrificans]RNB89159.1 protease complex subunit PrcB family protein [Brevibacillus nitrificans]